MENNENLNNQVNETNNIQEEKKNNNKTIGIVVLVISLLLLCFAGYKLFIEKHDASEPKSSDSPTFTPTPNNNQLENDNEVEAYENNSNSELLSYELDGINKKFIVNGKNVLLKVVEDESFSKILYINEQKTDYYYDDSNKIYLSKNLIILEGGGQTSGYPVIIDENGKIIMVSGNPDTPTTSIEDLHLENGKLIATKYYDIDEMNLDNTKKTKVELVFDNGLAQFKEVK